MSTLITDDIRMKLRIHGRAPLLNIKRRKAEMGTGKQELPCVNRLAICRLFTFLNSSSLDIREDSYEYREIPKIDGINNRGTISRTTSQYLTKGISTASSESPTPSHGGVTLERNTGRMLCRTS